jgi:protein-disulfide isomerase
MRLCALALLTLLPCLAAAPDIEKGKIIGNPSAAVRLEIYSDFQCPACKNLHETILPALMKDYVIPGKVMIVNHEFPLQMHKYSREAANYATAAARFGFYQPVADRLFEQQTSWSNNGNVWNTVASVLSPEQQKKVAAAAKEPAIAAAVQADLDAGNKEHINSTPTVILIHSGKKLALPYPIPYNYLKSLLDGYLR